MNSFRSPASFLLATGRRLATLIRAYSSRGRLEWGTDLHIGARTRIWAPSKVVLGNHVYIGKDVLIEANCVIGDHCLLANRVAIVGRHDHDFRAIGFPVRYAPWVGSRSAKPEQKRQAVIEDDVWIGYAAIVLSGTRLGRGCIVAAGSVISRDVPPYAIVAGNPAVVIGSRIGADQIARHEAAILRGSFRLSERGYDYCTIEPCE